MNLDQCRSYLLFLNLGEWVLACGLGLKLQAGGLQSLLSFFLPCERNKTS